jgi:hypothetical protein
MLVSLVLVIAVKIFSLNILSYALLNTFIAFDTQLEGTKDIISCRFKVNIFAGYHTLRLAFKQLLVSSLLGGIAHLLLKLIT